MDGDRLYPVFLDLSGRRCLVVGGGSVGARKAEGLLEAGACVEVVSPEAEERVRAWDRAGRIRWMRRPFEPGDPEGAALVFAATDSAEANREVEAACGRLGVPVNDARGEGGDFLVPASLARGPLRIAVSTGGASPAYARLVRERLEETFGPEHEAFLDLLSRTRPRVMERFAEDPAARRRFWEDLVSWDALALVRDGRMEELEERISECLSWRSA